MRLATALTALGLFAAIVLSLHAPASAQTAPSRVVDRTYRCAVGVDGGIRSLNVSAQTGVRDFDDRTKWKTPPHFHVSPAVGSGLRVRAAGVVSEPWTETYELSFYVVGCSRVSGRVPLVAKGLSGGRASQFGDRYQCPVPRTVLVRVRMELAQPASVGRKTHAPVRAGSVFVRTVSGKPSAYAEVDEAGRARLLVASNCIAE
jgi:hypothetical protein